MRNEHNKCVSVFQSEQGDLCYCCSEIPSTRCQEEKLIKIYAGHACGTMRILLKVCAHLFKLFLSVKLLLHYYLVGWLVG